MILGIIIGLIAGGCFGFLIACLMVSVGHGDERERELRQQLIKDVRICCAEYDSPVADSVCNKVVQIIRMEQV